MYLKVIQLEQTQYSKLLADIPNPDVEFKAVIKEIENRILQLRERLK